MVNNKRVKKQALQKKKPMQQVTRVPRNRLNFDGQILNSVYYAATPNSAVNLATDYFTVDTATSKSVVSPLTGVTGLYNTYAFEKVSFTWLPSVAPGVADAGSTVFVAYLDNVEKMQSWIGLATDALRLSAIRQMRDVKIFSAWERVTLNFALTRRRKWFDVNTTRTINDSDLDRSTQGMILIGIATISAITNTGNILWKTSLRLNELDPGLTT